MSPFSSPEELGKTLNELHRARKDFQDIQFALDQSAIVAMTDAHGVITYVNDRFCEISKYRRDELIGQTHRIVKSDQHSPEFFKELWTTITAAKVWRGTIKNRAKDATNYWVNSTITPLLGENGRPNRYVAIRSEITAQKILEEELRHAHLQALSATQAKSEFLANMSHEIRTPLNGVLGMASLLEKTSLNPMQKHYTEVIRTAGGALLTLINDILDFSKMEAGKLTLESIPFWTEKVVEDVLRIAAPAAQAKGLSLRWVPDESLPETARGDPSRLRQILMNLIGNAIKFTSQGVVTLSAGIRPAGQMRFEVTDTGIGLSEADRKKLFQPFSQADGSITRRFGGTGLGLAICRRLVEKMNGAMGVQSAPGAGSTFWFHFPYQPVEDAGPKETEGSDSEQRGQDQQVLVVDDNETNRLVACALLEKAGYRTQVAANGQEAVDMWATQSFAAILMDCQMPDLDGYQATALIRQGERERGSGRIPILGVTANALDGDRERVLAAGMDDYLPKPLTMGALSALMAKWVKTDNTPPAVDLSVFDEMKGINTPDGRPIIAKILETFATSLPGLLQDLRTFADRQDWPGARVPAHTLKGTAKTVGAKNLGDHCASILKTIQTNPGPTIVGLVSTVESEARRVLEWIRQYQKSNPHHNCKDG